MSESPSESHRFVLYYKGDISALVLFAQHSSNSVCFPEALPTLACYDTNKQHMKEQIKLHPAQFLNQLNHYLNLEADLLKLETGFCEYLESPGQLIRVHLARFMVPDPPHAQMHYRQCSLKTLPELRRQPVAELELLRRAYTWMMEG